MESRELTRIVLIAAGAYVAVKIAKGAKDLAWTAFGLAWVLYWSSGAFPGT
jgi:hypothetical protein